MFPEESILAVLQTSGGALTLQLLSLLILSCVFIFLGWMILDASRGRKKLHLRIDEVVNIIALHEKICAERWGRVSQKLNIDG